MSLTRKFKEAVVRYYNPNSGVMLIPAAMIALAGGYSAGSYVGESASQKPIAPLSQAAEKNETALLKQYLAEIGKLNKDVLALDEKMNAADEALQKADDVTAARDTLAKLTADKLEARFNLDDKTHQFLDFALLKTNLPEATVETTVENYSNQWTLPSTVKISYNYRDEVRATFDSAGLSSTAAVNKIHGLTTSKSSNWTFLSVLSFLGGTVGGAGGACLLLSGSANLRGRWQRAIWDEERAERERQNEIERIAYEKRQVAEREEQARAAKNQQITAPNELPPATPKTDQTFRL